MPIPALEVIQKRAADGSAILRPDGSPNVAIGIRTIKQFVKSYWLSSDPVSSSALAAGAQETLRFAIDSQGHFDWAALMGTFSVNAVMLDILDPQTNRLLSNKPVHSTTVVGSGKRYFRLPMPYFFNVGDAERELSIRVINAVPGAVTTTTKFIPYGRRFYHKEMPPDMNLDLIRKLDRGWKEYAYFLVPEDYDVNGIPDVVAGGARGTFTFDMDDNADMTCFKLMLASTGTFEFTLRERDKNRTLSSGVVHSANGWGNAEFPFYLADSYLLQRKRQLIMDLTDLSGSQNRIFATIGGVRFQYR